MREDCPISGIREIHLTRWKRSKVLLHHPIRYQQIPPIIIIITNVLFPMR